MILSTLGALGLALVGLTAAQKEPEPNSPNEAELNTAQPASSTSEFYPVRPPAVPLAVRSPYLSTWLPAGRDGGNGGHLPGQWPIFWTGQPLGWAGLIRVDNYETYAWMGAPQGIQTARQVAMEYTSTKSVFTIDVNGKVGMNITFLSPVFPHDVQRQSLPFSYVNIEVWSADGHQHPVQIYTDISAEWASGDRSAVAQWKTGFSSVGIAYHKVWKQTPQVFSEANDQAEWGSWYYATEAVEKLTFQSGADTEVREAFVNGGVLSNAEDPLFRAINKNYPVFGYALDLAVSAVAPSSAPTVNSTYFSIGLLQWEAVRYQGNADRRNTGIGETPDALNSLWTDYYVDEDEALSFFHNDFETATKLSKDLDDKIAKDSLAAGGQDYMALTTLAVRQAFGATELVGVNHEPLGPLLFMKEISSNGNMQTVDVIYPASPIFLYLNPELLRMMLDPLYENQENGLYPNKYAMHDLGTHFPNATGHSDGTDEPMPLEECGNMIIMTLAYAQKSGNTDYLKKHIVILEQWAAYLISDALYPAHQLSTDDFAGPLLNQTNLALKGIIALQAMHVISELIDWFPMQNYSQIAHDYISKWVEIGTNKNDNPPHTILNYGNETTHGLLYNLYNDRLLSTHLVPDSLYKQQSAFYPTVANVYGVPLDTRHDYTKGDWEIFTAAVSEESTKRMFISKLAKWTNETPTSRPFTDLYETGGDGGYGDGIIFCARPVMGGMFALLALP
ncbi:glutaminase A [Delitschia confertaspora ATCC 74209]|uniref:Glutaminase A n=1 Tax=Delitschia confertaspora ATCC 74209 TaxID=1513339 RepID=A0A9P4JF91_9PLEO|nr:glutaminase A [Delitschia confertaspora ATCC 74209]